MAAQTKPLSQKAYYANLFFSLITFPILMVILAGNWRWIEGWIFGLWISVMILSNLIYMFHQDPALLTERMQRPGNQNQKKWDTYLMSLIGVMAISWLVLLPLDAGRFHWSPAFPLPLKALGGLLLVPALYLIYKPTTENTFMSTQVRIQAERKQRVISTGVYGFVRHPLYLGCVLMLTGAPLLLGSLYGLIISGLGICTLVVRILGEEKMLLKELDGYAQYQQQVRYRLIPFVW